MGKWGMHSGAKANEKQDGGNEKIIGSSGDPLLTPQGPKTYDIYEISEKVIFCTGYLNGKWIGVYVCVCLIVQRTPPRRSIVAICLISQCVGMVPS